jgi:signal transduction histidine kinase
MEAVFEIAGRAVRTSMAPIEAAEGKQQGVVALLRDVTAQVQAEADRERQLAHLWEQNQELEKAAEHLQDLAWVGKMDLALRDMDLQELIEDAVTAASALVGDKPVTLLRALELDLPVVQADRTRLRQVLLNLLSTAIKHMEQGQIAVSALRGKGYAVVSIAHIGRNISPQYVEALCEEFGWVDEVVSRKVDGLRLGLSVSRRLIELHGGKTWVRKGRVLVLYFGLPINGPPVVSADREVPQQPLDEPPASLRYIQ